jgi:hypothetical protein
MMYQLVAFHTTPIEKLFTQSCRAVQVEKTTVAFRRRFVCMGATLFWGCVKSALFAQIAVFPVSWNAVLARF